MTSIRIAGRKILVSQGVFLTAMESKACVLCRSGTTDSGLINGRYSKQQTPDSASKINVSVLSEPVYGGINQEGMQDAAVLLELIK